MKRTVVAESQQTIQGTGRGTASCIGWDFELDGPFVLYKL